ncbi:L,D-transpeptidase [Sphingoaurantiacus capsulatus]|uniref:L,D-transpeptidase n=1 Tax=Sphingoaurantiacus capsulatus TaxID=1771310 RepID=A0ABV7XCR9_9SPHN
MSLGNSVRRRITRPFVALLLLLPANELAAQGAATSSPVELARRADQLKPGQWVWAAAIAPTGPLLIYVDLSRQQATVYRNGVRIAVSTVSSGKPGHETPTGVFTILQKDADHHSRTYNNAPMPFAERLTWDGIALHAGGLPGYPESHGCVHLPLGFAKLLFGITELGATVVVSGAAADHIRTGGSSVLQPVDAKGKAEGAAPLAPGQSYRWTPEASPFGPVTVIASKSDQMLVVLRNGIEIGRSSARFADSDPETHVVTLAPGPNGQPRWIYVGLPGHATEAGKDVDEAALNRVDMPKPFHDALVATLRPGATVLVTQASLGSGGTGKPLTLLTGGQP